MFFRRLVFCFLSFGLCGLSDCVPRELTFEMVSEEIHPRFEVVKKTFETAIKPLYGDQQNALNKIIQRE